MKPQTLTIVIGLLGVGAAAADTPAEPSRSPTPPERRVSVLHLRPQAQVQEAVVTLSDVLDFSDADPRLLEALKSHPVATAAGEVEISYEQVVAELDAAGVNLARVLVDGAYRCRVSLAIPAIPQRSAPETLLRTPQPGSDVTSVDDAPLFRRRESEPMHSEAPQTLADAIRAHVAAEFTEPESKVEVAFERGRRDFLELTTPPMRFVIRSAHGPRLGLREFKVTLYREQRRQRTISVFANVRLERRVLVAARPLNIGAMLTADSVEPATRIFSDDSDLGITHAGAIVGQKVKRFVPAGEMLRTDDLEAVDLVRRSRPVTVSSDGAIGLRVTGTALDAGKYGETIRVRLGSSRRDQRVIRGIVVGAGQVRMLEDG